MTFRRQLVRHLVELCGMMRVVIQHILQKRRSFVCRRCFAALASVAMSPVSVAVAVFPAALRQAVIFVMMTVRVIVAVVMIFLSAMLVIVWMGVFIRMRMNVFMGMCMRTDISIFIRYNMHFFSLLSA